MKRAKDIDSIISPHRPRHRWPRRKSTNPSPPPAGIMDARKALGGKHRHDGGDDEPPADAQADHTECEQSLARLIGVAAADDQRADRSRREDHADLHRSDHPSE